MPSDNLPPDVHRVKARLTDGSVVYYFSLRGRKGSGFYKSEKRLPREREFYDAYAAKTKEMMPKASGLLTEDVIDSYYRSAAYSSLSVRTKADYRKWLDRFKFEFGADPIKMFEEKASVDEIEEWRSQWQHSPKQYDDAVTTVTILLNWACRADGRHRIDKHHCRFTKVYKPDRAQITWLPQFIDRMVEFAPLHIQRLLIAACETGMRPQDLVTFSRFQIEKTSNGNRRIRILTKKTKRPAFIPVTPALAEIIDTTPSGQESILVTKSGSRWTPRYASQCLKDSRNEAGLTEERIGYALHLHDCRGTAATTLLEAGAGLFEIASVTGWSVRYAAQMIEVYAVVTSDKTDAILEKLKAAKKNRAGT